MTAASRRLIERLVTWVFPVDAMVIGWRAERDERRVAATVLAAGDRADLAMAVLTPDDPDLPEEAT